MGNEARRGLHVGVLIGVSTAAYAATLAGVTTAESTADRALIAARDPIAEAVAAVASDYDALERRLGAPPDHYSRSARDYAGPRPPLDDPGAAARNPAAPTPRG